MIDLREKRMPPRTTSFNEILKEQEPWSELVEELLEKWKRRVQKLSDIHDEAGYIIKSRYYKLAVPSVIIPFTMGFVSQVVPTTNVCHENNSTVISPETIVDGAMFMITGVINGLIVVFGYGELYEKHFQYSARYASIVNRIDSELSKRRQFRGPASVFLAEIKCEIDSLGDNSPDMPLFCC